MLAQAPPPGPALGGLPEKPADDEPSRALAKTCIVEAFRKLDPSGKGCVPRHAFVQVVCLLFFPLSEKDANKLLVASGALAEKDECVKYLLFADWIMAVPRTPRQEAAAEANPGAAALEGDDLELSLSKPLSEQTWLHANPSPHHSISPEDDAQEVPYECTEGEQQKSAPMKASRPVVAVAAPAMQQKAAPPPAPPAALTTSQLAGALEDLARRWEAVAPEARLPQEEAESFFGAACASECAELLRRWHGDPGSHPDATALAARYPDDEGGRRALLDDAQVLAAEPLVQEADKRLRLAKYARRHPTKEVEWRRLPSEDAAEGDFDPGSTASRIGRAFDSMLRTWDQASDEVESSPRLYSKDERAAPSQGLLAPEPPPELQKAAPPPRAAAAVAARAAPVEPPAQQAPAPAASASRDGVAAAVRLTSLLQEEVLCGPEGAWADQLQSSKREELGALLELLASPSAKDLVDLLSGKTAAPPPMPSAPG